MVRPAEVNGALESNQPVATSSSAGEEQGQATVSPSLVGLALDHDANPNSNSGSLSAPKREHVGSVICSVRIGLRILTYFIYDGVADAAIASRDSARVVKVLAEMAIDEAVPPNFREEQNFNLKFLEYLAPCGISSLLWFILRRTTIHQKYSNGSKQGVAVTTARGIWIVCHRILRQALICRLFTRRGSLEYNLTSALGLVCTFFREELFSEIHRLHRWPRHVAVTQGLHSCLRTAAYTLAFLLPLQDWIPSLHIAQRRTNVKKLIFAVSLANARRWKALEKSLASILRLMLGSGLKT